jgi:hypothetical protein
MGSEVWTHSWYDRELLVFTEAGESDFKVYRLFIYRRFKKIFV